MTADGDDASAALPQPARPAEAAAGPKRRILAAPGSVLCLFDGSPGAIPRLRLAAESAVSAGRPLVVAHIDRSSTGCGAAAFTGYGACLGPADHLLGSTSEAAFAAAVLGLADIPVAWDFAACRGGCYRRLRQLADDHDAAVVVIGRRDRLFRRLSRDGGLTVLAVA